LSDIEERYMKPRESEIKRKTKETDISGKLVIDGTGKADIKTGIGFLDHMLELFAFHGLFDLKLKVTGDLKVDRHHTNEDIGICLGRAFREALGDCKGIRRYGSAVVPMDEARAKVAIDISNRYAFKKPTEKLAEATAEGYSVGEAIDFLESFAKNLMVNLHVDIESAGDMHHTLEAVFKAFGMALDQATQIDPRRKDVPSTKGIL
jgi:imidazoleglycerol-phosphate dehydratase